MKRRLFLGLLAAFTSTSMMALSGCGTNGSQDKAAMPLVSTTWQVTDYPKAEIQPSGLATLQIQAKPEGHSINGNSSCNQYFGQAKLDGNRLRFDKMGSTRRACMDMKEERLFLTRLRDTQSYQINGNELTLLKGNVPLMVLLAKAADSQ